MPPLPSSRTSNIENSANLGETPPTPIPTPRPASKQSGVFLIIAGIILVPLSLFVAAFLQITIAAEAHTSTTRDRGTIFAIFSPIFAFFGGITFAVRLIEKGVKHIKNASK